MPPPYHDGTAPSTSLLAGCVVLCPDQDVGSAVDTGLLLQALVLAAQQDVEQLLPYVLRPIYGWQLVQCGLC